MKVELQVPSLTSIEARNVEDTPLLTSKCEQEIINTTDQLFEEFSLGRGDDETTKE